MKINGLVYNPQYAMDTIKFQRDNKDVTHTPTTLARLTHILDWGTPEHKQAMVLFAWHLKQRKERLVIEEMSDAHCESELQFPTSQRRPDHVNRKPFNLFSFISDQFEQLIP